MLGEHFQSYVIKKCEIPKLPEKKEKLLAILESTRGQLKIIERQGEVHFGTTIEYAVKMECPLCHSQFTGWGSEGCFHSITYPLDCPVCGFPSTVLKKLLEIKESEKKKEIKEIKAEDLDPEKFIEEKVKEIKEIVGEATAIVALSGGVDSSTTTVLAHKALGEKLKVFFIDNGLMREGEPEQVKKTFEKLGINVQIVNAQKEFFDALKGLEDPEEKRKAIRQTFYQKVLARLAKETGAKYLLHGTILTDIEETVAGIKLQHNILVQMGINTEKEYGYQIIEPLRQLRKDGVRKVAMALGLPPEIYNRMPFLGPALAGRIIGEVTPERVAIVRKATKIVEEELKDSDAFQYMAILHKDRVTGIKEGKREFGYQIEVRCWESIDARTATPTELPWPKLTKLAERITNEVPGVVSVTYNITPKPPSTMEAV